MSSGAAVVTTENGGVRGFAGDAARYAAVGDAAGLTRAVLELLEDEAACTRLAREGQVRVRSYTPADAGLAFEAALLRAASAPSALPAS
jgi:glycosyltransferase involved in cell wall biosynthesis